MKKQLVGKIGSVYQDKNEFGWWGWYYVTVFFDGRRHTSSKVEFNNLKNHDDIPWQDEPISIELDTETFEITVL